MVEPEEGMNSIPMLANIQAQPGSHRGLLALHQGRHQGSQRATLKGCAGKIRTATGAVIFSGMGGSLFATLPAVSRLSQQGYAVRSIESAELLHYGRASLRAGDVGVVVSRSGGSIEPVLLAEAMRQSGMTVIGVTNVSESKLEQIADITLMIGSQADKLIAVQSYTGTVLTLLLLAEEILTGESDPLSDACSTALPLLSAHIDECLRQSDHWQDLLMGGPLYLLGRGPALGAVYEGALLLHETAKTAAVGMSSGQFRHGPAEILSGDFCAVVFGTPPPTQALDRSLADDLFSAGAKIRWIGPAPETGGNDQGAPALVAWPQIPAVLAPLFEIVPIQVAAYRLALWRGITPGDFRFVSEVTAAESGFLSSASSHA
jgi:glucosamine--fructose-6-phosphate aminotransferase (isomerizing)